MSVRHTADDVTDARKIPSRRRTCTGSQDGDVAVPIVQAVGVGTRLTDRHDVVYSVASNQACLTKRRRIIAARYQPLVDSLYSDRRSGHIETEITFEDGRKGRMSADVMICDVATSLPALEPVKLKQASCE